MKAKLHRCKADKYCSEYGDYGCAVTVCFQDEDTGELWVTNDEYSNRVRFCPFCGWAVDNSLDGKRTE